MLARAEKQKTFTKVLLEEQVSPGAFLLTACTQKRTDPMTGCVWYYLLSPRARCNTDAGSVPLVTRNFSPSQLSAQQTLLQCSHNPACNHMLKIPNTGSHAIVWTRGNAVHTLVGMGSAALAAVVLPRYRNPSLPYRKNNNKTKQTQTQNNM